MSGLYRVDTATLGWVKAEIDHTLAQAHEALSDFERSSNDVTPLRMYVNFLHQVVGTLQMVELDGAAMLAQEAESLAQAMVQGRLGQADGKAAGLLDSSLSELSAYLERLQRGMPDVPVQHTELMNALRGARGEDPVSALTLFYPDLSVSPPPREQRRIDENEYQNRLRDLRRAFQGDLLRWLRNVADPDSLEGLQRCVGELQALARFDGVAQLWWIAGAFLDTLASAPPGADDPRRRIPAQLDQRLRKIIEGGEAALIREPDEDLAKAILYEVGRAKADTPRIREVRSAFDLDLMLTGVSAAVAAALSDLPSAADLKRLHAAGGADLQAAQDGLAAFFEGGRAGDNGLGAVIGRLQEFARHADAHKAGPLAELTRQVASVCRRIDAGESVDRDAASLQMAAVLLFIDESLKSRHDPDLDWKAQVDDRLQRLQALQRGAIHLDTLAAEAVELTDGKLNTAQIKQLLGAVAGEIYVNLQQTEEALESYAADPSKPAPLAKIPDHLSQVQGVLRILGQHRIAELLGSAIEQVRKLFRGQLAPSTTIIEALAVVVGTTESYVQGLEQDRPRLNALVERAEQDLEDAVAERDTGTVDPHALIQAIQGHLDDWLRDNADYRAFRRLRQSLRDLSALANRREKSKPRRIAMEMNNLLDIVTEDPTFLSAEVEQTLRKSLSALDELAADLVDQTVTEAPAIAAEADVGAPAKAEDEQLNAEIREVFLEEANECVAAMDDSYQRWRRDTGDRQALTDLRRQFHTLKGSGRIAKAGAASELAWFAEDVLNRLLDDKLVPSDDLFVFVNDAKQTIKDLLKDELKRSGRIDLDSWKVRSQQIIAGGRAPSPGAAPAEPAASVDATVVRIFTQETLGHLNTLRGHIDRCKRDAQQCKVSKELLRAVHTLRGSSRSLHLVEMSDAFASLDELLQALEESGQPLQAGELEIFDRLTYLSAATLDNLNKARRFPNSLRQQFEQAKTTIQNRAQQRRERPVAVRPETEVPERRAPPTGQVAAFKRLIPEDVQREIRTPGTTSPMAPAAEATQGAESDVREIFYEEAADILARINQSLERWRESGDGESVSAALKRDLHTLKGSARAVAIDPIGDLSHATESVLEQVAKGATVANEQLRGLLEEVHDTLVDALQRLREGREPAATDRLLGRLAESVERPEPAPVHAEETAATPAVVDTRTAAAAAPPAPPAAAASAETLPPGSADIPTLGPERFRETRDRVRVKGELLDKLMNYAGEVSITRAQLQEHLGELKTNLGELGRNVTRFRDQLRDLEIQAESQIRARSATFEESGERTEFDPLEFDRYTRLQQLSRSLSESLDDLVTIQNGLLQFTDKAEGTLRQQSQLSTELQDGLLSTRMVPFSTLIPRLRHQVRQTARELNKRAELTVSGEVEIDRNVLDSMTEAFDHMIRNALDHGIESEDRRVAAGKPPTGQIRIECRQEGGEVVLRFSDDGAGLDVERIRAKAEAAGMLRRDAELTDQELMQIIVLSGFSTAETVSKLSGRGIGMDVVHNAVRRLGGGISVESEAGKGTTFVIRLPLSLSITQALFVRCGGQEFAIALAVIESIVKADAQQLRPGGEGERPSFVHLGRSYPLMDLTQALGLPVMLHEPNRIPILLVRMGARHIAVKVEGLVGTQEVVVKSVGEHLAAVNGIVGATIRGDGSVVLILDLAELWMAQERPAPLADAAHSKPQGVPLVMVVDDSLTVRKVTSRALSRYGMQVMMAKDGIDAMEQINNTRPDLMLVDIEMPRMDGFELTKRVRSDPETANIPIVIITSRAGHKHKEKALELGANAYLTKPYQEDELVDHVKRFLRPPADRATVH